MPYSDNLYSMVDDDSDVEPIDDQLYHLSTDPLRQETLNPHARWAPYDDSRQDMADAALDDDIDQVLSPSDGYFRGPQPPLATSPTYAHVDATAVASSNVPRVPNVWVFDPSLPPGSTAESKAREADQERLANRRNAAGLNTSDDHDPFSAGSRNGHYQYNYHPYAHSQSSSATTNAYPDLASTSGHATQHSNPSSSSAYTPSTVASYSSYTPRRPGYQHQPFPVPREAPPAYTPSPTSPSNSDQPSFSRNYQTFPGATSAESSTMGRREESQGLLANEPESMGSPDDEYEGVIPVWRERVRRRLPYMNGRACRVILLGLVLLLVTIGFLVSSFTALEDERDHQRNHNGRPVGNERPTDSPDSPSMDSPLAGDGFSWRADDVCKDVQIPRDTQKFDLSFGENKQFAFTQRISKDDTVSGHDLRVSGDVVFRRVTSGSPGPSVILETVVNDDSIDIGIEFDAEFQSLVVTVPRKLRWNEAAVFPCIAIRATVWVPEDGVLESLSVDNVHLDIHLLDNLSMSVSEKSKLKTLVGHIGSAMDISRTNAESLVTDGPPDGFRFDSRFIEVKTVSSSITGNWPLLDYLALESVSGSIQVGISPKPASEEEPKPAVLYVNNLAGSVTIEEPIYKAQEAFMAGRFEEGAKYLPPRDYRVDVRTTSSSIKGSLAFSQICRVHSTSGGNTLTFLPVLDGLYSYSDGKRATLETSTTSGSTNVEVLDALWTDLSEGRYLENPLNPPPYFPVLPIDGVQDKPGTIPIGEIGDGDPYLSLPDAARRPQFAGANAQKSSAKTLRCLESSHTTTSASIKLTYPQSWEGDISLNTASGMLKLAGKDVQVKRVWDEWPGYNKHVLASKGPGGGGKLYAKASSGSVNVIVGER